MPERASPYKRVKNSQKSQQPPKAEKSKEILQNSTTEEEITEKMLRHILQAGLTFCLVSVAFATDHTERSTYGIPDTCTCGFDTLPRGKRCRAISDNECYPDHQDLGISADCLPDIEDK